MTSIITASRRAKDELFTQLGEGLVRQACDAADHEWRRRVLPPWVVLRLFALQVLSGNVACRAVTRLSGLVFTAQAYCAARAALPVDVLGYIAAMLTHEARQRVAGFGRWKGHRVLHVDGIQDRTKLDWQVADWASAERPTDHWLEIRLPEPVEGGAFHLTWSLYELQFKAPDSDTWQRIAEEKQNTQPQHAYPLPNTPITALRIHQPAHQGNEKRPDLMWVQQVAYQAN